MRIAPGFTRTHDSAAAQTHPAHRREPSPAIRQPRHEDVVSTGTAPRTIPPLRPAATVVVVRPGDEDGFEVLLVRRSDRVAFMAGAYVFPGGRVDDGDDAAPEAAPEESSRFEDLDAAAERRHRVAALRELLEEAGVLLASTADAGDGTRGHADAALAARVRAALQSGAGFTAAVHDAGLHLSLEALVPFAHWVTPEIEIRRFDTRFYLARMPDGQDAAHDDGEMTALEWVTPAGALARCAAGTMRLPPPTWTTLTQLARFTTLDAAAAWARSCPIPRLQPRLFEEAGGRMVVLPGDPLWPAEIDPPFAATRFVLHPDLGWIPAPP